jgi:AcrR family transcriptional regulator
VARSRSSGSRPARAPRPVPTRVSGREGLTREQAKQETRDALIQAAMAAIAEEGLDAPSLDAICARAGYTRGAFYVHFKDRDDLIAAVMDRVTGVLLDALIATGDAAMDLERTVRAFVDAVDYGMFPYIGAVLPHQVLQACVRSPALRTRYAAMLDEAVRRVQHAVREGQEAGSVRPDVDARHLAVLLVGMVLAVQNLTEVKYAYDIRAIAETILRLLRPGG